MKENRSRLNTIIEHLDGRHFDLMRYGIVTRDFIVSSPEYAREIAELDGLDGAIETDVSLQPRPIAVDIYIKAEDNLREYVRLRDFVFEVFGSNGRPFYIRDVRFPTKRWLVRLDGGFAPVQERMYGFFTVNLIALSGVSESNNVVKRGYNETTFDFRNGGTEIIDMRSQTETEIIFRGASEGLTIKNDTTGDEWRYNGSTSEGDIITLKGVRSTKNGQSIFGQTNKKLISIAPGNNKFEVRGASGDFELNINTRFYFV